MKFLWFIDKDNDIWRFSNDYSYTIYFKDGNYKENNTFKVTKDKVPSLFKYKSPFKSGKRLTLTPRTALFITLLFDILEKSLVLKVQVQSSIKYSPVLSVKLFIYI